MLDDVDHVFFDLFGTLLDLIGEDTDDIGPYEHLSRHLFLRGVVVDPTATRRTMQRLIRESMDASASSTPDVDMREIFSTVLAPVMVGEEDYASLITEAALAFRIASTAAHVPIDGMIDVVRSLVDAGVPVSLVSNTQRLYSEHELRAIGLHQVFQAVVFSSDVRACKPDPAPFRRALELTGVDPARALYVGDNPVDDVLGAHGVGMRSVLFDRGRPAPEAGPRPVAVVSPTRPEHVLELVGLT